MDTNKINIDMSDDEKEKKMLQMIEERFKTIFEQAPLGIALIDSNTGHIYEVNSRFAKICGRSVEEMSNIDWMQITHPDDIKKDQENMALLNAGKIHEFSMEKRYIHPDGKIVWINMTIAPLKSDDNTSPRHLCMIEDITERKHLDENIYNSQMLLKRIINLLPVRIFWKDKKLVYLGCNNIFAKDAGKNSPEELIGKDDFDMGWKDQAKLYQDDDLLVINSGKPKLNFEEVQTTPNGETIWLRTNKVPLTNLEGNVIGILGSYEDITKNKLAEDEIKKSKDDLLLKIDELDRTIKLMVGRELSMIELKNKITELEKIISNCK